MESGKRVINMLMFINLWLSFSAISFGFQFPYDSDQKSSLKLKQADDVVSDQPSWQLHPSTHLAPTPVIIDTDVGSFIDDTFAIVYAAQSKQLDIKLIITCTDDTIARAKVTAKLLKIIGRDDIPIGIGIRNDNKTYHTLFDWAKDVDLSEHKGGVYMNGVDQMGEIIENSPSVVDIIAIGPMTNFPALLSKYPDVWKNARVRAMAGSVRVGYHNTLIPVSEYNVEICVWCMQVLLTAGWEVTITPLDTCGNVTMSSKQVELLFAGDGSTSFALASSLAYFCAARYGTQEVCDLDNHTPVLYDVIAPLLALPETAEQFMDIVVMNISVNSTGYTVVDDQNGVPVSVALQWKDGGEQSFLDNMTQVLL